MKMLGVLKHNFKDLTSSNRSSCPDRQPAGVTFGFELLSPKLSLRVGVLGYPASLALTLYSEWGATYLHTVE